MSTRWIVILTFLWVGSLIGVATVVAQVATQPVPSKILSGSDVGFEVVSIDDKAGAVVGHIVVNVNGKWVQARIGGGGLKLTP